MTWVLILWFAAVLVLVAGAPGASAAQASLFHCGAERSYGIGSITAQRIREDNPAHTLASKPAACGLAELVVLNQFQRTSAGIVPRYRHRIVIQPGARVPKERWQYTWRVFPGPSEIQFVARHGSQVVKFTYSFDFPNGT